MSPLASNWLMRGSIAAGVTCVAFVVWAQAPSSRQQPQPQQQSQQQMSREELIAQGEYLTHHVAMCVQCHSPRTSRGQLNREQQFEGAPIPLKSPFDSQRWATRAPRLAGLPGGWSEESLAHFLETGEAPLRTEIRPPMPEFRMNSRDAAAVAAYLNSLE